jgi:rubredoxin
MAGARCARGRDDGGGLLQSSFYSTVSAIAGRTMKKYMCLICGWIYDEETGAPEEGIPPGTRWEDVPPNWSCPECGARKEDFELIEI